MQGSFENGDGVSSFQSSLKLTARLSDTLIRVQFTLNEHTDDELPYSALDAPSNVLPHKPTSQ